MKALVFHGPGQRRWETEGRFVYWRGQITALSLLGEQS
jgi:hypothetical protein